MSKARPITRMDHLIVKRVRSASGTNWLWRTRSEIKAFEELNRRQRRANRIATAASILGILLIGAITFAGSRL